MNRPYPQNYSTGGDALESHLQHLHLQDYQQQSQHQGQYPPQPQQSSTQLPPPPPPQFPNHDPGADFEPPPGPPPNWIPSNDQAEAIPNPAAPIPPEPVRPSQAPIVTPADPAPRSQALPKPSVSWKFPEPHPCGVTPLVECPSNMVTLDLDWFQHPSAPSFYICTRCYAEHVYDPRFHQFFQKVHVKAAEAPRCSFSSPRMQDQIWPATVSSGDLGSALEFMKKRGALPPCQEATLLEGRSWYVSVEIPGSTLCPACFEDVPLPSELREKYTLQTIANGCYCDSSLMFVNRVLRETKEVGHWQNLVQCVTARLSIPPCPGRGTVKAQGRPWYVTGEGHPNLQICVACYLDYFVGTADEGVFNKVGGGDYDTHCEIGNSYLTVTVNLAVGKQDLEMFWKGARRVKSPPCTTEGIQGENWYTLIGDPPGFGICGACYTTVVESMGAEHFFIDKGPYPSHEEKILCGFNPQHGRFGNYFTRFLQTALTGDAKYIGDYTMKYGKVLTCPCDHYRRGKNRKFWGWGVCAICEECYVSFARGTSLEGSFALKGDPDPKGRMCDMYSPRMRKLYLEACETGDLRGFLALGEQRHEVWCATIAVCDRIEADIRMATFQANRLRTSANFYKFLGHSIDNTIGHSHTVGNSYAGYGHVNEYMLTGHTHERQAQEASADALSMSKTAQMAMLRRQWAEVE